MKTKKKYNYKTKTKTITYVTGRPTKYNPSLCKDLIEHMKEGLSFEAFAGKHRVSKDTMYVWLNKHPEFANAKNIGTDLCRLFWEKTGRAGVLGKIPNFNATVWIFNMKNRFGWRDKHEIEQSVFADINITMEKIETLREELSIEAEKDRKKLIEDVHE